MKRTLGARWYVAGRTGYTRSKAAGTVENFEATGAVRPNRFQTIKFSYGVYRESGNQVSHDHVAALQLVTSLRVFSRSRD